MSGLSVIRNHCFCKFRNEIARRLLSSSSSETPKERKKKQPRVAAQASDDATQLFPARYAKELEEYFGSTEYHKIVDTFPTDLLRRTQYAERFYLAASERANVLSQYVTGGLAPGTKLVEVNPGPGLLTKKILQNTDNLLLYESDDRFKAQLEKLLGPHKNTQLRFLDFNGQWRQSYLDLMDQEDRVKDMLQDLPRQHRWRDEEVNFRLFSVIGSRKFFKTLINSVATQTGIFGPGRCEMILAVPPLIFAHLTCGSYAGYKLYRSNSVLFQIFFEHELIAKIPRKDFLPWPTNPSPRRTQTQYHRLGLVGTDDMYLMRVVPRRNLFDFCLPDNLKLLTFFVTQNMISRKNRVIPALERWIPFCGARLIISQNYLTSPVSKRASPTKSKSKDTITFPRSSSPLRENDFPERMTIFTEFGELSPSQMLTVFNEFINWPEFQQSPFLQSMEQHYSKLSFGRSDPLATTAADGGIVLDEDDDQLLRGGAVESKPAGPRRRRS